MRALLALLLLLSAERALAHAGSTSYLQLSLKDSTLQGRWDVALRDLDFALNLDADGDGALTWGELRAREADVSSYLLARLGVDGGGPACTLRAQALQISEHNDGAYAALPLTGTCAGAPLALQLDYQLFFDLDPSHRGLLNLDWNGARSAVFSPEQARQRFAPQAADARAVFGQYLREGLWHVWTGWDHLLFIAALLLPAALRRQNGAWVAAPSLRAALWETAGIITAFTLAHACTLAFTALGWVSLPTRWVETAVAATVIFAGLNNVWPMVTRGLWLLALGFGFIHGTAIAGALLELGLPTAHRVWALLAFNLGVEAAQLALAALVVPLSFALRHAALYRRAVLLPGSLLISAVGLWWLVERIGGP